MATVEPTDAHEALFEDMKALMAKHSHLDGIEMLAVASQFVGALIAFQDQTKYSSAQAMDVVSVNIEAGNRMAISQYLTVPEGSA